MRLAAAEAGLLPTLLESYRGCRFIELNPCPHGIRLSEGIAFFCRPGRGQTRPGPVLPVIGPRFRADPVTGTVERLGFPAKGCFRTPMSEQQTAAELITQGLVHHRADQISLAMDRYTQVLRNDPRKRRRPLLHCHGRLRRRSVSSRASICLAARSGVYRPQQARAHNLIGQALHRMGKDQRTRWKASTMRSPATPSFADAYGNRANMLSELGRNAEALSSFDRAIALNPNSRRTTAVNRGATLHGAGRIDDSHRQVMTRPSRSTRTFVCPHCNRAHALFDAGRAWKARGLRPRAGN